MRLLELRVHRLPGIERPFRIGPEHLDHELLLVSGANASGKSSLCRAVRVLLWSALKPPPGFHVEATWRAGGRELHAVREGTGPTRWFAGGDPVAPPDLPPPHLARCFVIGPDELLAKGLSDLAEADLVRALKSEIAGGFDTSRVESLLALPSPQPLFRRLREVEAEISAKQGDYRKLETRRAQLAELETELEDCRKAGGESVLLEAAIESEELSGRVESLRLQRKTSFPEPLEQLSENDLELARRLEARWREQHERLRALEADLEQARDDAARLGSPDSLPTPAAIKASQRRLVSLHKLESEISRIEQEREACIVERRKLELQLGAGVESRPPTPPQIERWKELRASLLRSREREAELAAELAGIEGLTPAWQRWAPWILSGVGLVAGAVMVAIHSTTTGVGVVAAALLLAATSMTALQRGNRERRRTEAASKRARDAGNNTASELRGLAEELGLDPSEASSGAELLERVRRWHALGEEEESAAGRIVSLRQRLDEQLRDALRSVAEHLQLEITDLASATIGIEALEERVIAAAEARDRVAAKTRELERTRQELASTEVERRELYRRVGLEEVDLSELERRTRLLPAFRKWHQDFEQARTLLADRRERLADRKDLLQRDAKDLERELVELRRRSQRQAELVGAIAAIEAEVKAARRAHALADLLAERAALDEQISAVREQRARRVAGRALLAAARESHARDFQPELLRRAGRLFARFTERRYQVEVDAEAESIVARDLHLGRTLGLGQLSGGTRAQLWLAARLALAGIGGGAQCPPLFLDEALAAADPLRFAAIAAALEDLAAAGQQVIYLTADPGDVAAWRAVRRDRGAPPPQVIDLGALRAEQALPEERPIEIERARLPDPETSGLGEYARILRLPEFDARQPIDSVHLLHLLPDDLRLVRDLHDSRIETVGQWRLYAGHDALPSIGITPERGRRVDARILALSELREAWLVGRPAPVTAEDIEASGAVSEVFRARCLELLHEVEGDAARLLEVLREGRLPRFQQAKIAQLERYLRERNLIDDREPLDADVLRARVLAALAGRIEDGDLDVAMIDRLIDTLLPERVDA